MYFIEVKRENWCINYLDIDYSKPTENLDEEIEYYPTFKSEMHALNKNIKFWSIPALVFKPLISHCPL